MDARQQVTRSFVRQWIAEYITDFNAHSEQLGELDRLAGDGDFAVNMTAGLKRARRALDDLDVTAQEPEVASAVSQAFLNTGGTSGPLLGMWFRDIARALAANEDPVVALALGVADGTATVQRLGGAQPGDKTMVDAMVPAADALRQARDVGAPLGQALNAAAAAAHEGAQSTTTLTAKRGRASYVGEVAVGVTDPGAAAIALFFRSGASSVRK